MPLTDTTYNDNECWLTPRSDGNTKKKVQQERNHHNHATHQNTVAIRFEAPYSVISSVRADFEYAVGSK